MLKVGLIGVGGISGAHIPAWDSMEDVELVALCDVRPEQMSEYKDIKRCYTNVQDMFENEELDIVDICLPTYLHAEYSIMAMERGINVLCEKPISLCVDDVKKIYDVAEKNNVFFRVAHVLRFWSEYEILYSLVKNNTYGKVLSGSLFRLSQFPDWSWENWMRDEKRSGLVPFDMHIHDLDFLVYLFGEPQKVTSHRSKRVNQDYICATYNYGDFFINCEASWYAGSIPFSAGFRIQFEKAVVCFEEGTLIAYPIEGKPIHLAQQAEISKGIINLTDMGPYANEIRHFVDCVLNKRKPDKIKPNELEIVIKLFFKIKKRFYYEKT